MDITPSVETTTAGPMGKNRMGWWRALTKKEKILIVIFGIIFLAVFYITVAGKIRKQESLL